MQLEKGAQLKTMLEVIVQAKRDGMIDHREARDLWLECLRCVEFEPASTQRPNLRGAAMRD